MSKKFKTNKLQSEPQSASSQTLSNYFDVILPNQEFLFAVKNLDSKENDLDDVTAISVYFETKYYLYPLCVLPGFTVELFNLIKKSDKIYKANSIVRAALDQDTCLLKPSTTCLTNLKANAKSDSNKTDLFNVFNTKI